jgi:hypothetical protein
MPSKDVKSAPQEGNEASKDAEDASKGKISIFICAEYRNV